MSFFSPLVECSLFQETDLPEGKDGVRVAVLFLCAEVSINCVHLFSSFSKDLQYTKVFQKKIKRRKKGIQWNCRR